MIGRPLTKVTLNLYEGDWEKLRSVAPNAGAGAVIRNLVASFLERVEGQMPSTSEAAKKVLEEIHE
jgi:hypothetical protein